MHWINLKDNKCPRCGSELKEKRTLSGKRHCCSNWVKCNFFIPQAALERRLKDYPHHGTE